MPLSKSKDKPSDRLFCSARKEWVASTPEELVRQKVMHILIHELGFPFSGIALEKSLDQMPHLVLKNQEIPDRRADLICFARNIHSHFELYPLLLIECKAIKLSQKVIQQVTGYNHFVQAYFVAVVNQNEIQTGWYDPSRQAYRFINYLPTYNELLSSIKGR